MFCFWRGTMVMVHHALSCSIRLIWINRCLCRMGTGRPLSTSHALPFSGYQHCTAGMYRWTAYIDTLSGSRAYLSWFWNAEDPRRHGLSWSWHGTGVRHGIAKNLVPGSWQVCSSHWRHHQHQEASLAEATVEQGEDDVLDLVRQPIWWHTIAFPKGWTSHGKAAAVSVNQAESQTAWHWCCDTCDTTTSNGMRGKSSHSNHIIIA